MSDKTCSTCKFGLGPIKNFVVCCRFPPVPVLTHGEKFDPGDSLQGFWPRVDPDAWCGEHRDKNEDEERLV